MSVTTQVCRRCGRELPADATHFYPNKSAKSGLRSDCRVCTRAYSNGRYTEKHDHCLSVRRAYVAAHPERVRETNRKKWRERGAIYNAAKKDAAFRAKRREQARELAAITEGKERFSDGFSLVRYETGYYRPAALTQPLRRGEWVVARFERHHSVPGRWVIQPPALASRQQEEWAAELIEREYRREAARKGTRT